MCLYFPSFTLFLLYYYQYECLFSAPGLSLDDQITLPYPVVIGFEYLLESIPMETEAFLDATVEAVVNGKLDEIEAGIDAQIDEIKADETLSPEEKNEMIAQLNQTILLIEEVRVVSVSVSFCFICSCHVYCCCNRIHKACVLCSV